MPGTQKRLNPVDDSPPKASEKRKKENQPTTCLICDETIKEATDDVDGDDAVYCEGDCRAWLHRKCVYMSKQFYDKISVSDDPYHCPNCASAKQSQEISVLKQQVEDLTKEIACIKALKQRIINLEKELSVGKENSTTDSSAPSSSPLTAPVVNKNISQQTNLDASPDRRYNLIIQGISECPSNMKKFERFQSDQQNVLKELSNLDSSINPGCVKDTFRLGKYKKDSNRPRPILVKLLRSSDVQSILSKRSSLKAPISIRPDMTLEERDNEKILLKQRWLLLQRGINRQQIKICGNSIFMDNKLYGKAIKGQFHPSDKNDNSTPAAEPVPSSSTHNQ